MSPVVQPEQGAARAVAAPRREPIPLQAPEGFDVFFRASYLKVVSAVRTAGATREEAEDAASEALTGMVGIWPVPGHPLAYACKAAISNFIKAKTRGNARLVRRLIERGHITLQATAEDPRLASMEGREWTDTVLRELTEAQRELMQHIVNGMDRNEIAAALSISKDAARRRLADARARLLEVLSRDGELRNPRPPTAREEAG